MPTFSTILLACTTLTTALIAGLLYGYFCSVNPGLNRLSDAEYVSAMQSINRAIQNPIFFVCFLGTPVLLPLTTWLQYSQPISVRFWLVLAATIVYLLGVLGVTALGNIPLNEGLDAFTIRGASLGEIAAQRAKFEAPWNAWHTTRTIASILALVLLIVACLSQKAD